MTETKNKDKTIHIVRLAMKICYYYIMKNFIQPIKLFSLINNNIEIMNYDNELIDSISNMKNYLVDEKIDFEDSYGNYNDKKSGNETFALKIKDIGRDIPKENEYNDSEIFINIENKTIQIKTKNGFKTFPLNKKSIVRTK